MALKVNKVTPVDGYVASKQVNDKKLIHNVRRHGDTYFNTGDLLMIDEDYYIYFKDRIGDTFRYVRYCSTSGNCISTGSCVFSLCFLKYEITFLKGYKNLSQSP